MCLVEIGVRVQKRYVVGKDVSVVDVGVRRHRDGPENEDACRDRTVWETVTVCRGPPGETGYVRRSSSTYKDTVDVGEVFLDSKSGFTHTPPPRHFQRIVKSERSR